MISESCIDCNNKVYTDSHHIYCAGGYKIQRSQRTHVLNNIYSNIVKFTPQFLWRLFCFKMRDVGVTK